jgi:hypothetical protein
MVLLDHCFFSIAEIEDRKDDSSDRWFFQFEEMRQMVLLDHCVYSLAEIEDRKDDSSDRRFF